MIFTETQTAGISGFIPDEKKSRILCFGDSLTWGADPAGGPRLSVRWPRVLQYALGPGYEVIEEGHGGRNIATDDIPEGEKNGMKYILPCLETHDPFDLLIIMLGVNDCKRKFSYSLPDISMAMERFLQKVLTHRNYSAFYPYEILLIAPPPMNEGIMNSDIGDLFEYEVGIRKSQGLAERFQQLAEKYGIGFMDAGQYCQSSPVDGLHMDAENQQKLGLAVADYIRKSAQ